MALHGTIQVNGQIIATWEARRTDPKPAVVNTYECVFTRYSLGMVTVTKRKFTVEHAYDDGAMVLAQKVIGGGV